jgi:uncharacterized membrane protein
MKPTYSQPANRKLAQQPFGAGSLSTGTTNGLLETPRSTESGRGLAWLANGWEMFRRAPWIWVGMVAVWAIMSVILGMIPVVNLASNLIYPVFTGGFMIGCQALAQGRSLEFEHLFAGFQRNFGSLLLLGALSLVGTILILGLAALAVLGTSGLSFLFNPETVEPIQLMPMLLALLVALALMIPLIMAFWFAPALVALHDTKAMQAISLSFRGCVANILPFLLYGLAALGLSILATVPLGLGWLVLMPVLIASSYAAYREIFVGG